jgi:hypothetical protein
MAARVYKRARRLTVRAFAVFCLPGAVLIDLIEWWFAKRWPLVHEWFWCVVTLLSTVLWLTIFWMTHIVDTTNLTWEPCVGLSFGGAARLSTETDEASAAMVTLRFELVPLLCSLVQILALLGYTLLLIAIKVLSIIAWKPWLAAYFLGFGMWIYSALPLSQMRPETQKQSDE